MRPRFVRSLPLGSTQTDRLLFSSEHDNMRGVLTCPWLSPSALKHEADRDRRFGSMHVPSRYLPQSFTLKPRGYSFLRRSQRLDTPTASVPERERAHNGTRHTRPRHSHPTPAEVSPGGMAQAITSRLLYVYIIFLGSNLISRRFHQPYSPDVASVSAKFTFEGSHPREDTKPMLAAFV